VVGNVGIAGALTQLRGAVDVPGDLDLLFDFSFDALGVVALFSGGLEFMPADCDGRFIFGSARACNFTKDAVSLTA